MPRPENGRSADGWTTKSILSIAYVDDGERLIVGVADDRVRFLDADTLRPSGRAFAIPAHCCAAGAPDGGTAMVFEDSCDGAKETWRVIDTGSGKVLNEGQLDLRAYSAAFSPDGEHVAVTGNSGEVVSIDVSSGRVTPAPRRRAYRGGLLGALVPGRLSDRLGRGRRQREPLGRRVARPAGDGRRPP